MTSIKRTTVIDDIPADELEKLEKQVFKATLDEIWDGCVSFFNERDPEQLVRAAGQSETEDGAHFPLVFGFVLTLVEHGRSRAADGLSNLVRSVDGRVQ